MKLESWAGCDASFLCFHFLYQLHRSFEYNYQLGTYTGNLW